MIKTPLVSSFAGSGLSAVAATVKKDSERVKQWDSGHHEVEQRWHGSTGEIRHGGPSQSLRDFPGIGVKVLVFISGATSLRIL